MDCVRRPAIIAADGTVSLVAGNISVPGCEPVASKGSAVGSSTSSPGPQDGGGTASAVG